MTPVSSGWGDYARLMLVLCGVLALAMVAVRWWLPKLMLLKTKSADGQLQICARLPLEPRKTLYIVKAAHSYMLLASSEAGVHHLAALSAEECAEMLPQSGAATLTK